MRGAWVIATASLSLGLCACGPDIAAAPHVASQRSTHRPPVAPARKSRHQNSGDVGRAPRQSVGSGKYGDYRAAAGSIGVLERPRVPGDALPASALLAVTGANATHIGGNSPVHPTSARRVQFSGIPPLWVLGGSEAVCLMHVVHALHGTGIEYSLACAPWADATNGRLLATVSLGPVRTLIEGVVPDGTHSVAVSGGGHPERLKVHGNVYAGIVPAPLSVTWDRRGAKYSVPLPHAPGTPAAELGIGG
jgi:hypothetical protein